MSKLIIPSWAKNPEPPKPRDLRAEMLAAHPLPWHQGEQHDSRCDIMDANNKRVGSIHTNGLLGIYAGCVADVLLPMEKKP